MNNAPTVFAQIMAGLDPTEVARAASRFPMPRASRTLRPYDHLASMVFAQLTYRESLRGIETCLGARPALSYHMGIRGRVTRPAKLRRISFVDPETGQTLIFVTNQFELAALIIAQIYRRRWAIELFFRWIKQHLRLRGFHSTSFNGVRVQIWTALAAYLLVAIAKRRLNLPQSLWEILQIVSITSIEHTPLQELLIRFVTRNEHVHIPNQLDIYYS